MDKCDVSDIEIKKYMPARAALTGTRPFLYKRGKYLYWRGLKLIFIAKCDLSDRRI